MASNWAALKLPADIVEYIFKDLHSSDFPALKNCALTCRAFLLLARIHLFRNVTISLEPGSVALANTPHGNYKNQPSELLSFLASDPHVSFNIRSLHLQRALPAWNSSGEGNSTTVESLRQMLSRLNSLVHLAIHSSFLSDWTIQDRNLRQVLVQFMNLPDLQDLELFYMTLFRWELPRFIKIPSVTLIGAYLSQEDGEPEAGDAVPRAHEDEAKSILCKLCIMFRAPENAEEIYSIAHAASRTLKSLTWVPALSSLGSYDACLDILNLPALPLLSHLAISLHLHTEGSLTGLLKLLEQESGQSSLEILEIVCDYGPQRSLDDAPLFTRIWNNLDELLSSSVYATLRIVKLELSLIRRKDTICPLFQYEWHTQRGKTSELLARFQSSLPRVHSAKMLVINDDK